MLIDGYGVFLTVFEIRRGVRCRKGEGGWFVVGSGLAVRVNGCW
jgi:hypothetical protein